jgi:hypothetical protein
MSTDIFGRRALDFGGAFAADSANIGLSLECTDGEGVQSTSAGLLTQTLNVQYQQPITRLYEVGTQMTYYVAGRPQGTATIARILGPGVIMAAFYACLGDVCRADQNDLCFCIEAGCIGNADQDFNAMRIGLKNVVLQSLGISIQAQDMIINEQLSLFFTALIAQDQDTSCYVDEPADITVNCFESE